MKFPFVFMMLILLALNARGQQNLVSNHSFEGLEECPNSCTDWRVIEWTKPNGKSSDNFNRCAFPTANYSAFVPLNNRGFQNPYDGDGYVGIVSFSQQHTNTREYVQTEMIDSLTGGIRYYVGFHASAADRWQYAISTLGAALTTDPPPVVSTWHPDGMLEAEPQVLHRGRFPLTDTVNWVLISDTVLAQGGERYLTIGNFHLDGESDTLRFNPNQPPIYSTPTTYAYYYIDDVFVYAIDSVPNGISDSEAFEFSVHPNPSSQFVEVNAYGPMRRLRLLDMRGREVVRRDVAGREHKLDLGGLPPGMYFLEVTDHEGRRGTERIIKTDGP